MARKADEKNGSFVCFSCLLPELWSLNCQKLCSFCIFFADVSNKSKAVIAVYGISYYAMTYNLEDISV